MLKDFIASYSKLSAIEWGKLCTRAALELVPGGGTISVMLEPVLLAQEKESPPTSTANIICAGTLNLETGEFDGFGVSSVTDMGLGAYGINFSTVALLPYHSMVCGDALVTSVADATPGGIVFRVLKELGDKSASTQARILCLKV